MKSYEHASWYAQPGGPPKPSYLDRHPIFRVWLGMVGFPLCAWCLFGWIVIPPIALIPMYVIFVMPTITLIWVPIALMMKAGKPLY